MTYLSQRFTLTATALAAAALLAACGGGGSASAPAGSVDTTAPTILSITDDVSAANASGNVTFTFTFSEAVSGFTADDVTVTGGTKGTFTIVSTTVATLVVIPTANSTGTLNISVAANAFVDTATNANTATANASQAYDTTTPAPTTTIATFDETPQAYLDPFELTTASVVSDNGSNVGQLNKTTAAQAWGGATFHTCPAGTVGNTPAIPFTSTVKSLSVMVKSPRAGVIFTLKAEGVGTNAGAFISTQTTNTGTGWEKLTFNFANKTAGTDLDITKTYNKFSIFPNWSESDPNNQVRETADRVYLFDDLKLEGASVTLSACPPQQSPTASASNPSGTPVVTVYSDAAGYTPIGGITWTWQPGWNGATPQTVQTIGSDNILKYSNFGFSVIEGSSTIDVSSASYVNMDVWTPDVTTFRLKLVDYGANGVWNAPGGDDTEHEVTEDLSSYQRQWRRVRIPLSNFTGLSARNRIGQIILSSPTTGGTVFVDNIHFSSN